MIYLFEMTCVEEFDSCLYNFVCVMFFAYMR